MGRFSGSPEKLNKPCKKGLSKLIIISTPSTKIWHTVLQGKQDHHLPPIVAACPMKSPAAAISQAGMDKQGKIQSSDKIQSSARLRKHQHNRGHKNIIACISAISVPPTAQVKSGNQHQCLAQQLILQTRSAGAKAAVMLSAQAMRSRSGVAGESNWNQPLMPASLRAE